MSRLLLLEDNPLFRESFALLLLEWSMGLDIVQVGSVAEAGRVLDGPDGEIDFAIVAIDPVNEDRIELIEELCKAEVPVLAIMAGLGLERRARALRAGADEVLLMRAPLEELAAAVSRLVGDPPHEGPSRGAYGCGEPARGWSSNQGGDRHDVEHAVYRLSQSLRISPRVGDRHG